MRARPVRFSVSTGLRLCGIADEPFWPSEKNSSASSTSVRCRWRISVASRSTEEATTPSVAKNAAWRSRGITWVEIGSGFRPSFARDMRFDARVDVGEGADRAGDRAGRDLLARRDQPRSRRARTRRRRSASFRPKVVGSAWMPCERPIVGVILCSKARRFSAASSASTSAIRMSLARCNCTARQVSSTSELVSP